MWAGRLTWVFFSWPWQLLRHWDSAGCSVSVELLISLGPLYCLSGTISTGNSSRWFVPHILDFFDHMNLLLQRKHPFQFSSSSIRSSYTSEGMWRTNAPKEGDVRGHYCRKAVWLFSNYANVKTEIFHPMPIWVNKSPVAQRSLIVSCPCETLEGASHGCGNIVRPRGQENRPGGSRGAWT